MSPVSVPRPPLPMRLAMLLCILVGSHCSLSLRICSFNVQTFGRAKAANRRVMGVLVKIVSRCDICLLMEVRDAKGQAVPQFISQLNQLDPRHRYSYVASERLGRSSYKEQNVFVYRVDKARVLDVQQYKVRLSDTTFARDPTIVRFSAPNTVIKEFALISQHTCPEAAVREVDGLFDVSQYVKDLWAMENIMILGDLNAGCSYISPSAWSRIRLRSRPDFHWLIGDGEDTTVCEATRCPYDRIIVHGPALYRAVEPGSAKVFDFRRAFGLTEEEALAVSDHFPVEVQLKERARTHVEL